MGTNQGAQALVVMTNGDVYYIDANEMSTIMGSIYTKSPSIEIQDVKSGAAVTLMTRHISSVVKQEGKQNA